MTYIIITLLVTLSALFSGLTIGFFSLNKDDLKRKAQLGNRNARKIYTLREQGNLLLCTLLVGNVTVNSALAIFLGSITTGILAGFFATALIVIFGEIIPQAFFARHALSFGAKFYWPIYILQIILFPVCYPIAWTLDKVLGAERSTIYSKRELIKLIEHHEDNSFSDIDEDEEDIVRGALSFSHKQVKEVMTPREKMFALDADQILSTDILQKIKDEGFSRIPVYKTTINAIVGILYAKELVGVTPNQKTVGAIANTKVTRVLSNTPLDTVLNKFRRTRNHLFIVQNNAKQTAGIITIEDVIEEILGREILDEYDDIDD